MSSGTGGSWPLEADELRELYHGRGLSLRKIGEKCGVRDGTVLNRMRVLGVETRGNASYPAGDAGQVGDLEPDRTVYVSAGGAGRVAHLSTGCPNLPRNGISERDAAVEWDTTKICTRCRNRMPMR